jgi:hypothetical protein
VLTENPQRIKTFCVIVKKNSFSRDFTNFWATKCIQEIFFSKFLNSKRISFDEIKALNPTLLYNAEVAIKAQGA